MGHPWLVAVALVLAMPLWRVADLRAQPGPVFVLGALLCLVWWIARTDWPLAAFLGYAVVQALLLPSESSLPTVTMLVLGAVLYAVVRDAPERAVYWLHLALLIGGGIQVVAVVVFTLTGDGVPGGTLGNANYLGAYLALTSVVVPTLWLPVWAIGVICTKSALAGMAFGAAVLLRYRHLLHYTLPASVTTVAGVLWWRGLDMRSWRFRWAVWRAALAKWSLRPLWGYGAGSWLLWTPQAALDGYTEIYGTAHNDYLQLGYEFGVVGVVLLAVWCWSHRTTWSRSDYIPALAALAIEAAAMFPFHIAAVALPAVVVLGLATRRKA